MRGRKRESVLFEPEEKALVARWIKEQRTESTKEAYQNNIENFRLWYKKPLTEFLKLDAKNMRSCALDFQDDLKQKGVPANTRAPEEKLFPLDRRRA